VLPGRGGKEKAEAPCQDTEGRGGHWRCCFMNLCGEKKKGDNRIHKKENGGCVRSKTSGINVQGKGDFVIVQGAGVCILSSKRREGNDVAEGRPLVEKKGVLPQLKGGAQFFPLFIINTQYVPRKGEGGESTSVMKNERFRPFSLHLSGKYQRGGQRQWPRQPFSKVDTRRGKKGGGEHLLWGMKKRPGFFDSCGKKNGGKKREGSGLASTTRRRDW